MKTKPWYHLAIGLIASLANSGFSQELAVEITPTAAPTKIFTAQIPDPSLWRISFNHPEEADPDASNKEASRQVSEIEIAYNSGLRRETVRYANQKEIVNYIAKGLLIELDPESQTLLFDDPADRETLRVYGLDQWGELSWVTPKYFVGTGLYLGRTCDVYRQFVRPLQANEEYIEGEPLLAAGELNGQSAEVYMTAYIDSETAAPLALEKGQETLIYERLLPFKPFSLPANVREAVQQRNDAIKKREQRFNISK